MGEIHKAGEDYLEAILQVEQNSGRVRSVDVAKKLSVSRPSVNKAMGNLCEAGMVQKERYGDIILTEEGRERAAAVLRRHELIKRFLAEVLGVDDAVAEEDACKMEHIVSPQTMALWTEFILRYLQSENASKQTEGENK
ncbi:MAG: metal-dependent transcriptional regulator [Hydrogenoanaerobacterium sp.]